jgi:hypothetical protein
MTFRENGTRKFCLLRINGSKMDSSIKSEEEGDQISFTGTESKKSLKSATLKGLVTHMIKSFDMKFICRCFSIHREFVSTRDLWKEFILR